MIQFFVFGEPFELLHFAFFSLDVSDDVRCYAFQLNISFGELGSVHTFIFRVYEHFLFLNHSLSSIFSYFFLELRRKKQFPTWNARKTKRWTMEMIFKCDISIFFSTIWNSVGRYYIKIMDNSIQWRSEHERPRVVRGYFLGNKANAVDCKYAWIWGGNRVRERERKRR